MSDANKALVVRYSNALWNEHDYDIVDELAMEEDPAGFEQFARGLDEGFTQAHLTCGDPIAEGDRVALPWSVKGTLAGPVEGSGAPGEAVEYQGVALFRIVAGKIVGDGAYTEGFGSVALGQLYDGLKRTESRVRRRWQAAQGATARRARVVGRSTSSSRGLPATSPRPKRRRGARVRPPLPVRRLQDPAAVRAGVPGGGGAASPDRVRVRLAEPPRRATSRKGTPPATASNPAPRRRESVEGSSSGREPSAVLKATVMGVHDESSTCPPGAVLRPVHCGRQHTADARVGRAHRKTKDLLMITLRRSITALAVGTGLVAVTAGPASAGLNMSNHCPPRSSRG